MVGVLQVMGGASKDKPAAENSNGFRFCAQEYEIQALTRLPKGASSIAQLLLCSLGGL